MVCMLLFLTMIYVCFFIFNVLIFVFFYYNDSLFIPRFKIKKSAIDKVILFVSIAYEKIFLWNIDVFIFNTSHLFGFYSSYVRTGTSTYKRDINCEINLMARSVCLAEKITRHLLIFVSISNGKDISINST